MDDQDRRFYQFGPFVLDTRIGALYRDGEVVRLTQKALEVLIVLVENNGKTVEKERLMSDVWSDTFVEEGVLSRNVHEIRKVLGDDPSDPHFIKTLPRRGYRFVADVKAVDTPADPAVIEGRSSEVTLIEKRTIAHMVSEQIEESESSLPAAPIQPA